MGKARVTPEKYVSVPLLEFVAAMLSVKMAKFLRKEFNSDCLQETFWSDGKVVLGYIKYNKEVQYICCQQNPANSWK